MSFLCVCVCVYVSVSVGRSVGRLVGISGGAKYVQRNRDGQKAIRTLLKRGIVPRRHLHTLWLFNRAAISVLDALSSRPSATALAEMMIAVLKDQDLVFEHSGPLSDVSMLTSEDYYLIPEAWTQRLEAYDNPAMMVKARALPTTYSTHVHIMMGWRIRIVGWALPSFFRKLACRCIAALTRTRAGGGSGRVVLGREALRWESAEWPAGPNAMVLWLEQSEQGELTLKIAGLKAERDIAEQLSIKMARVVKELVDREPVSVGDGSLESMGSDAHRPAGDRGVGAGNRATSRNDDELQDKEEEEEAIDIPLHCFELAASPYDVTPNFSAERRVPRLPYDPEFIVLSCGFDRQGTVGGFEPGNPVATRRPNLGKIKAIVATVMRGRWDAGLRERLGTTWRGLLEREQTKIHIRVLDTTSQSDRLYVCLPSRNLYVPAESFHNAVLEEFGKELLRLLQALRAKKATVMIRSVDGAASDQLATSGAGGEFELMESAVNIVYRDQEFPPPLCGPTGSYPRHAEPWFFQGEPSRSARTLVHGLDLTAAAMAITAMKSERVVNGAPIGSGTLEISYSKSSRFRLFAKSREFGAARFRGQKGKTMRIQLTYEAQVYEWNQRSRAWG